MGRWVPDARGRLLRAALVLFADQGYEATTAAQIAARAGLTKTTLFRLFVDKREILFQGQPALVEVVTSAVASAPEDASALELLHTGLGALCGTHAIEQQEIGRQIAVLVASSPDLRERATFKRAAIASAVQAALAARLQDERLAAVLADIGVRAYYDGFDLWISTRRDDPLTEVVLDELDSFAAVLSTNPLAQAIPTRGTPRGGVGPPR